MTRGILGTILWACLAACIGVGLFFVKHEVKDQEHHLNELTAEIQRNQETIHVLRAEWSYLNDPARLRALSEKHLGMHPVMPAQVATLDSVLRNGMPAGTMLAAARPAVVPSPPAGLARPVEPAPKPQTKLADNQPRPHPVESSKPSTAKPPPVKPGGGTLANAAPPPTMAAAALPQLHPATAATTPAHGSRSIVISSPALAQSDGGNR